MNAVLARQYRIILSAIDERKPSSYLSFLSEISDESKQAFGDDSLAFVPYPVNDLIDELRVEGIISFESKYELTPVGKELLKTAKNDIAA